MFLAENGTLLVYRLCVSEKKNAFGECFLSARDTVVWRRERSIIVLLLYGREG